MEKAAHPATLTGRAPYYNGGDGGHGAPSTAPKLWLPRGLDVLSGLLFRASASSSWACLWWMVMARDWFLVNALHVAVSNLGRSATAQ